MSINFKVGREDISRDHQTYIHVDDTLTFSDGLAWGAIPFDNAPVSGVVDIVLDGLTGVLTFDFDFPGTRLDPASNPTRRLSDTPGIVGNVPGFIEARWAHVDGAGSLIRASETNNTPIGVYGVEFYSNRGGAEVQAAYLAGEFEEPTPTAPEPAPPFTDPMNVSPVGANVPGLHSTIRQAMAHSE